jgi:uncharacterized membrane protein
VKTIESFYKQLEQKIPSLLTIFTQKKTHWIIIGVGIILRIAQYLYNRSLTEGEAALAINIVQRSYRELLEPLALTQAAPIAFLMLQKFSINVFGNSELSLRLFPLIAGIISIFLFLRLAQKTIYTTAIPIALILFVIGDHLIYFSSEVKQYSSDVTIALLLILMAITVLNRKSDIKYILLFGIVGALSFWFSHPAVFIFYGAGLVLLIVLMRQRNPKSLMWLIIAGIIATVSLSACYFTSLESISRHSGFLDVWQKSFMPLPPKSLADFYWFIFVFLRTFKFPVGLSIYELLLAVLSFIAGCIVIFHKKKSILGFLIVPILITLIASGLRKYAFEGRLLLFITPAMVLIIAEGIDFIRRKSAQGSHVVGLLLVGILLIHPVARAAYRIVKPRAPEELRPVIAYVKENQQQGDFIYLYYAAENAFVYYSDKFGYTKNDYITGIAAPYDWQRYYEDLKKLQGNERVWILFSHIVKSHGVNEEKLFVSYLNILGTQLDICKTNGASAYLYDLSRKTH